MKNFVLEILRDKNGDFSIRECVIAILVVIIIVSWIAQQFFSKAVPEFMFYSFISLIAAGCFGYSIEKKAFNKEETQSNCYLLSEIILSNICTFSLSACNNLSYKSPTLSIGLKLH